MTEKSPPFETEATHSLATGSTIVYTMTANKVHTTPAKKLFLLVCNDGKYMKPPPDECGGTTNMS